MKKVNGPAEDLPAAILLNGRSITPEAILCVARGAKVLVAPAAMKRVAHAHGLLLQAATAGQKIYGLTVGVGLNKDRAMLDARGPLGAELIEASKAFNIGLIRSHCAGIGPDLNVETVRAVLATRLNTLLVGGAGVQPKIIDTYVEFLNKGITPSVPSGGSLGEADITILGHVGLAMLGEGEVYYRGQKLPAAEALKTAGIAPIAPFAKDALAIFSSNAYAAGTAALALNELAQLSRISKYVYALSLEALNGNVSPFLADTIALRPFPSTMKAAEELRTLLDGSYLWERNDARPLQDPLSFRTAVYTLGALDESQERLRRLIAIQLNSSDDNPGVAVGTLPRSQRWEESKSYLNGLVSGAVLPSANFDPLPWVIAFEEAAIALAHHTSASAQRIIRLNDPAFTGLSRFLGTERTVHAFASMEKPAIALASENRELANPVSLDFFSSEGNIEDVSTNAPRVVQRVRRQIENSFALLGIELIHAAQAIDLRRRENPDLRISAATESMYRTLRQSVSMLDVDRPMTRDFSLAVKVLKDYRTVVSFEDADVKAQV